MLQLTSIYSTAYQLITALMIFVGLSLPIPAAYPTAIGDMIYTADPKGGLPAAGTTIITSGESKVTAADSQAAAVQQITASGGPALPASRGATTITDVKIAKNSMLTPVPAPQPAPPSKGWHSVRATVFWVGEAASADNGYIHNVSSAWMSDWVSAFGGIDDPSNRCGHSPCGFTPKENPFYAALPFGDYTENGMKSNLSVVPWYAGPVANGQSILKNRWLQVSFNGKTVYVQWEDVGPFNDDDHQYVFGSSAPQYAQAGLDLSPAAANYLGIGGAGTVSWRFVDASQVPAGPWRSIVTTSAPSWN